MKKTRKFLALLLALSLTLALAVACAPQPTEQPSSPATPEPTPAPAPVPAPAPQPEPEPEPEPEVEAIFTPGTFIGVGEGGYAGDITIEVTFDEMSILDIEVLEHRETEMFANIAFNFLIPMIIQAQSTDLDTIAGATYTSTALLNAVNDAIIQAGADPVA